MTRSAVALAIVCTALLLLIVWISATDRSPLVATFAALGAVAANLRGAYVLGKQRGAAVSWKRKGTVGR